MLTSLLRSAQGADRPLEQAPALQERIKVVLVEWAAYPLEREKVVGNQVVHCGLGRTLEAMKRWPPGLAMDVIVVINRADEPVAPAGTLARLRRKVERTLRVDPAREIERRMRTYARLPERYPFVKSVHFRNNRGQDFGAYDFGYRMLQREGYEGDVLFMNSSVSGPHESNWLQKYRAQFMRHDNIGLCGISLNSHDTTQTPGPFAPHVQSFFFFTNMGVLRHALGPRLFQAHATDKLDVIAQGEIGVSKRVLDAGYGITSSTFPEFSYRHGETWSIPYGDLRFADSPLIANTI